MLRIAGQTVGPIGLKFFVDTHGWPGEVLCFIFFPRAMSDPLASENQMNNFEVSQCSSKFVS